MLKNIFCFRSIDEEYLSKDVTTCLKGIFSIAIIFIHIRGKMFFLNDTILGMALTALGYLTGAIFFFVSGYGLNFSFKRNATYINDFPKKRILDLYVKYLIVLLMNILFVGLTKQEIDILAIAKSLFFLDNVVIYGWFVQAIIVLYIIFYFVMRFVPDSYKTLRFFIIGLVYVSFVILTKQDFIWIEPILAFLLGMIWSEYKCKIDAFIVGKRFWLAGAFSFVLFGVCLLLGNLNLLSDILTKAFKVVSAPLFVVVILLICQKIKINNKFFRFFGERTFELYLIQGFFINIFRSQYIKVNSIALYIVLVCVCTVISACLLHLIFNYVSKKFKNI